MMRRGGMFSGLLEFKMSCSVMEHYIRSPLVGYALRELLAYFSTEHSFYPKERRLWLKNSQKLYHIESATFTLRTAIAGGSLE
jgi:hypothetical protein